MTIEAIDHVQLAIPSAGEEAARLFYADLLGLRETPKPPELARRGGCWFEGDGVKVHCGVDDDFRPAHKAHVAFRVDEVVALATRARAHGFEVVDDQALPGHERVFIFDPFGNRLEFLKPTETRSLPFMGRDDREAIRVGPWGETREAGDGPHNPTLAAPPPVPPHEGEGGFQ